MNEKNWLENMARTAHGDGPPAMDVTARVIARIARVSSRAEVNGADRIMAATLGVSAAAAAIVVVYAVQGWMSWTDPLVSLLVSSSVVLQ